MILAWATARVVRRSTKSRQGREGPKGSSRVPDSLSSQKFFWSVRTPYPSERGKAGRYTWGRETLRGATSKSRSKAMRSEASAGDRPAGTDRQEIEWQYDAPGGLDRVEEWLADQDRESGLSISEGPSKELSDAYYDTRDRRLYSAGYGVRVRREGEEASEATIKTLTSAGAGNLRSWREISEPLESEDPGTLLEAPGLVGEHLRTYADLRGLHVLFEVHTHRKTFDLISRDAGRVGEVVLDDSEIVSGGEPIRLIRVEVEVSPSAATASPELKSFVEAMERALELRPARISKYEAGLSALGRGPGRKE